MKKKKSYEQRSDVEKIRSQCTKLTGLRGNSGPPRLYGRQRQPRLLQAGVKKHAEQVNKKRNAVAHQGEFCNVEESKAAIESARKFIETVVGIYKPGFALED